MLWIKGSSAGCARKMYGVRGKGKGHGELEVIARHLYDCLALPGCVTSTAMPASGQNHGQGENDVGPATACGLVFAQPSELGPLWL